MTCCNFCLMAENLEKCTEEGEFSPIPAVLYVEETTPEERTLFFNNMFNNMLKFHSRICSTEIQKQPIGLVAKRRDYPEILKETQKRVFEEILRDENIITCSGEKDVADASVRLQSEAYEEQLNKEMCVEDDATKDIIETPQMTEEAEDAMNLLFENIQNKGDKLKISTNEFAGAIVLFQNYKLVIYPTGKRFALKNLENGEIRFFKEEEQEILIHMINESFGVLEPEKTEEQGDVSESNPEGEPIIIKLRKGFDAIGLKKFVFEVDEFLKTREPRPSKVTVTTEEWKNNNSNFMLIPGAKKLFAKYAEAGLLACLTLNGFMKTAQEVYCIAYIKGKKSGDGVEFKNADINDFKSKLLDSLLIFQRTLIEKDPSKVAEILRRFENLTAPK